MITSCLSKNKIEQGRSGKDSLTGLLQVHSSVGWLPVSFQSPAYRELHICRVRSLSEKPEYQQLHHAAQLRRRPAAGNTGTAKCTKALKTI